MTQREGPSSDAFRDHFSHGSPEYARYRPTYPAALYAELARIAPGRAHAWDCATGSGQAALGLVEHFDRVIATDPSVAQLAAATPHSRVAYRQAPAEHSGLESHSAELVTVAQAVHWFDIPRFNDEARRVLVPGGIVAIWGYGRAIITPAVDALVERFYVEEVGAYWPPERSMVDARYATIPFPFDELAVQPFAIERAMTPADFMGYLRTWSAVHRYVADRGNDPVAPLERELLHHWPAGRRRKVTWPLFLRVGRT